MSVALIRAKGLIGSRSAETPRWQGRSEVRDRRFPGVLGFCAEMPPSAPETALARVLGGTLVACRAGAKRATGTGIGSFSRRSASSSPACSPRTSGRHWSCSLPSDDRLFFGLAFRFFAQIVRLARGGGGS